MAIDPHSHEVYRSEIEDLEIQGNLIVSYDFLKSTPTLSQFVSVFTVLFDLAASEELSRSKARIICSLKLKSDLRLARILVIVSLSVQ